MAKITFKTSLRGADKLKKQLQSLSTPDLQKLDGIVEDIAKRFGARVEQLIPVHTGGLKAALVVKPVKARGGWQPFIVAIDRKRAPHAWLVHFGTGERIAKKGERAGRSFGKMPRAGYMAESWEELKDILLNEFLSRVSSEVLKNVR